MATSEAAVEDAVDALRSALVDVGYASGQCRRCMDHAATRALDGLERIEERIREAVAALSPAHPVGWDRI